MFRASRWSGLPGRSAVHARPARRAGVPSTPDLLYQRILRITGARPGDHGCASGKTARKSEILVPMSCIRHEKTSGCFVDAAGVASTPIAGRRSLATSNAAIAGTLKRLRRRMLVDSQAPALRLARNRSGLRRDHERRNLGHPGRSELALHPRPLRSLELATASSRSGYDSNPLLPIPAARVTADRRKRGRVLR